MTKWQYLILSLFQNEPDDEHSAKDLGMRWGKNSGVFFATLQELEKEGWLMSRRDGRFRYYKLAPLGKTEGMRELHEFERLRGAK